MVIGGSLGATFFNNNLPNLFKSISKLKKISVTHQSGVKNYKSLIKNYGKVNFPLKVVKFVYDIEEKYEWADLVIARSGALTVSELSQAGIASILVPYPFAVDNHQYLNAKILEERDATIIVNQSEGVDKICKVLNRSETSVKNHLKKLGIFVPTEVAEFDGDILNFKWLYWILIPLWIVKPQSNLVNTILFLIFE